MYTKKKSSLTFCHNIRQRVKNIAEQIYTLVSINKRMNLLNPIKRG